MERLGHENPPLKRQARRFCGASGSRWKRGGFLLMSASRLPGTFKKLFLVRLQGGNHLIQTEKLA